MGKLGNYDNGWGVCAGKIRAQPLFTEKSFFDIHRATADMSRGAAARWGKLWNYDNGWGVCTGKIRAQPLFTEKSFFDIHRASAKNVRALALAL